MSEIKHQFTGGKMNKDVDERLVPNGEYRQAINVQVSTSEGSDVGTVQNILGNVQGCNSTIMSDLLPSDSSFTVGSIADEKNDSLYWLVSGQPYNVSNVLEYNTDWSDFTTLTDIIIRKRPGDTSGDVCEPVFVDQYAFTTANTVGDLPTNILSGLSAGLMSQIGQGWTVAGLDPINGLITNIVDVIGLDEATLIPMAPPTLNLGERFYIDLYELKAPGAPSYAIWPLTGSTNLYIEGYSYLIQTPSDLVGYNVEILTGTPDAQTRTVLSASFVTVEIEFYDGSGSYYQNLIKLELNTPINPWLILPQDNANAVKLVSGPGNYTASSFMGVTYGGSSITGSIENPLSSYPTPIPNNVVNVDIIDFDVTLAGNLNIGDPVIVGNVAGCIGAVGFPTSFDNAFTVVDCTTGAPLILPASSSFTLQLGATVALANTLNLTADFTSLLFEKPKVLNFNHEEYITGINIIDDMLFWTDGKTEPKKINIPRSVEGTDSSGLQHTRLINSAQSINYNSDILVKEEHITVVRKAPLKAPFLQMETSERTGITGNNVEIEVDLLNFPFSAKEVGEEVSFDVFNIAGDAPDFQVGDLLALAADFDQLPEQYELKVKIIEIIGGLIDASGNSYTTYVVQIQFTTSAISSAASAIDKLYVQLVQPESIFKLKLPRFAYRYKYEDNEYSSFSPFSEVAFVPGRFNYEPIKAYNEGMVNNIKSLTIKDFVPITIPLDVVQVDILYKNETSPTVYLLKSVTSTDNVLENQTQNSWNSSGSSSYITADKGAFKISSENVSLALPSSQSLRVYDNVPKLALAQEVTGNRIVYGNYEIGYESIQPQITTTLSGRPVDTNNFFGEKSIKSLRDYDVGVVWGDKYGRETPVKTAGNSVSVPKSQANNSSYLSVKLNDSPAWADYYRFYIKETSNEYYNLAMDRIYDAEDGNIWISFPSIDRNKIDEDTYIILKKGTDSSELVKEKARYKVVAIENEAPEYIKTSFERILRTNQDDSKHPSSCQMYGGVHGFYPACGFGSGENAPIPGRKGFSLHADMWSEKPYLADLTSSPNVHQQQLTAPHILLQEVNQNSSGASADELYVSWSREETNSLGVLEETISQKYHVINVDPLVGADASTSGHHYVSLASAILVEDEWITRASPITGWFMDEDSIHIHFWKKTVQNKPEFDGRFFVKILNDNVAVENLVGVGLSAEQYLSVKAIVDVFKVEDTALTVTGAKYNFNTTNQAQSAPALISPAGNSTNTKAQWDDILQFDSTGGGNQQWFIDAASFASVQNGTVPASGLLSYASSGLQDSSGLFSFYDSTSAISVTYASDGCSGTKTENVGDGKSNNMAGMKGVHSFGGSNFVDLSYSVVDPSGPGSAGSFGGDGSRETVTHLNWNIGKKDDAYNSSAYDVVSSLKENNKFRFAESPDVVYKILGVTKFKLFNFQGNNTAPDRFKDILLPGFGLSGSAAAAYAAVCGAYWSSNWQTQIQEMHRHQNRRFTYRIKYEVDPQFTPVANTVTAIDDVGEPYTLLHNLADPYAVANKQKIEFLTEFSEDGKNTISENPAIWETEPKEDVDIDIYYEASSSIPTFPLTDTNKYSYIPIGSVLLDLSGNPFGGGIFISEWSVINPNNPVYRIEFSSSIPEVDFTPLQQQQFAYVEKDNGELVQFEIVSTTGSPGFVDSCTIQPRKEVGLNWYNCWSFKNGVESNRIGDTYNKPYVTNGVTASSSTQDLNETESRVYGLIYSGLYNSTSSVNNLNQFIAAEKITKDINPIYGSIQKLYSGWGQGGDLVALCEDRVLKILANKDALFNADGNTNITSTNNVLGTATPYSGEFGISKNPESFASDAYRIYFTDKVRGSVMRLSRDGLTAISNHGMKDWFRDNLRLTTKIIGSFDDKKDEYNLTLFKPSLVPIATQLLNPTVVYDGNTTVTFREDVRGWVSFKTFTPENAISCANQYYSFKGGTLWQHNAQQFVSGKEVGRNTFYDVYGKSELTVVLNDVPGSVKSFRTLNYEGSQARVYENTFTTTNTLGNISYHTNNDGEYYNLEGQKGWYVKDSSEDEILKSAVETNLEKGSVSDFIEKEGKWFGYFAGEEVNISNSGAVVGSFNSAAFSVQGIGKVASVITALINGCMDPSAFNYMASANVDNGTCIAVTLGCTNAAATNYDPAKNTDNGSCIYFGCTDATAFNYNPIANSDDGSCIAVVSGCTNALAINYNPGANTDDGSCSAVLLGCTDSTAFNYNLSANTDDGSCIAFIFGCTDANAFNFTALTGDATIDVNTDNGSCIPVIYGCTDATADNYDVLLGVNTDDGSCFYEVLGCTDATADNYDAGANTDDGGCTYTVLGCTDDTACNFNAGATVDDGSCNYCGDPNAVAIIGNNVGAGCTNGCTYCNPVANLSFSNVDQTSFTVAFEEPFYPQDSVAQGYSIFLNGTFYATVNQASPDLTGWGTGLLTFTVTGLDPNTSYTVGIQRLCGGNYTYPPASLTVSTAAIPTVAGCTDAAATNYDSNATSDDGSCSYPGCTDANANNTTYFNGVIADVDDGSCTYTIGCTIGLSNIPVNWGNQINSNFDSDATSDTSPSSCIACIYGCTDATQFNYDDTATCEDGLCVPFSYGCTDATASNYNPGANSDDGLCVYFGCMDNGNNPAGYINNLGDTDPATFDPTQTGFGSFVPGQEADNYDATATEDDGSCTYADALIAAAGGVSIGDSYAGGIVFYLDGNGGGLVVADNVISPKPWGCSGQYNGLNGSPTLQAFGTGSANTALIMQNCADPTGTAAEAVDDLVEGGYSDWFLPSKEELIVMRANVGKGASGSLFNIADINGTHWTSSEAQNIQNNAWFQNMNSGVSAPGGVKTLSAKVRAIRSFTL